MITPPASALWSHDGGAEGQAYRWVHLDLTNPDSIQWVRKALPDIVAAHLLQPETRPRCERVGDGLLVNLRGVNLNAGSEIDDMVSMRSWVTGDLLVTGRLRPLKAVQAVHEGFEAAPPPSPIAALIAIAIGLTERIGGSLAEMEDRIDALEEVMFDDTDISAEVTVLRKRFIKLRRFVAPQRAALTDLLADPMSANQQDALRHIVNQVVHNVEVLDAGRDRLAILQEHIEARRNAALGRNSYILSVAAAIFLPLGFITGLFGVNLAGMPGMSHPAGFAVLAVACLVIGIALFVLFRWRRWL